jgi:hypothetical protein
LQPPRDRAPVPRRSGGGHQPVGEFRPEHPANYPVEAARVSGFTPSASPTDSNCPRPGAAVEQPNRRVDGRRTQVRIALRHREALMSDERLDTSRRRALHRQIRAERVTRSATRRLPRGGCRPPSVDRFRRVAGARAAARAHVRGASSHPRQGRLIRYRVASEST